MTGCFGSVDLSDGTRLRRPIGTEPIVTSVHRLGIFLRFVYWFPDRASVCYPFYGLETVAQLPLPRLLTLTPERAI